MARCPLIDTKDTKKAPFLAKYHKYGMPNDTFMLFRVRQKGSNFATVIKNKTKSINIGTTAHGHLCEREPHGGTKQKKGIEI